MWAKLGEKSRINFFEGQLALGSRQSGFDHGRRLPAKETVDTCVISIAYAKCLPIPSPSWGGSARAAGRGGECARLIADALGPGRNPQ